MVINQTNVDSETINTKIINAKNEAKALYNEVEQIKLKVKDMGLKQCSSKLKSIPNHSINPKLYSNLEGHQSKISKLQWNSHGDQILSGSQDGYMIIWDAVTGYKKKAIELDNQWVLTCSLSPNNDIIVSGGLDNNLSVYKVDDNHHINRPNFSSPIQHIFKSHRAYISDTKFLNNNHIISSSGDMKNIMWDLDKTCQMREFIDHTGDILCLETFPSSNQNYSNLFLSGSCDGYVKIWDTRVKSAVQSLFISNYDINSIKIFPQGQSFITGSDEGIIRLLDLRSDCELGNYSVTREFNKINTTPGFLSKRDNNNYNHHSSRDSLNSVNSMDAINILSVDFSHSGRLIYACYSDLGCLIWDSLKGEIIGSIGGHVNKINQVSTSPDGLAICTASWDSTIKVWGP